MPPMTYSFNLQPWNYLESRDKWERKAQGKEKENIANEDCDEVESSRNKKSCTSDLPHHTDRHTV